MKNGFTKERRQNMKIHFGSIFIEKEKLKEAGINYPIKLEYYKIINEDEMTKGTKAKFGISIEKTEYIENNTRTENEVMKYISNDEQKINEILTILKDNQVTPISMQDVIYDFSKQILFC